MKSLLLTLLLALGLLVVADRVGVALAERALAAQAKGSSGARDVSVDIVGFPFLTQALRGRYDDVALDATEVPVGQRRLARLQVRMRDVELPLTDALSGDVAQVPVGGITGSALLGYDTVEDAVADRDAAARVELEPGDEAPLRVTGSVRFLGRTLQAAAQSDVRLDGRRLVVRGRRYEVAGPVVDGALNRLLRDRLDVSFTLPRLPYGLKPTGVEARPEGLRVGLESGPTVLERSS